MDPWWPLLFIIGAVALIVGPVMMLQPNKFQQKLIVLRQAAAQLGIRIRLEDSDRKKTTVAVYSLAWPTAVKTDCWCLKRQSFIHDMHFLGDWHWDSDKRPPKNWLWPLKKILASLPPDIIGLEGSTGSLGVFWLEKQPQTTLATIEKLLKQSQEILSSTTVGGSAANVNFEPEN